jgi:hypothetical protein
MRHTVIGLFDTYTQAESARDALVQTGFARADVELQANPEPRSAADVDPAATSETGGHGFMANIERFLSSLFSSGPRPEDTARYTEAVRRGAVLVCVSAASESHAQLAQQTLAKLGAVDIGERPPTWESPASAGDPAAAAPGRDHSMLDELGIGAATSVPPAARVRPVEGTVPNIPPVSSASRPMQAPPPPVTPPETRQPLDLLDPLDPANAAEPVRVEARNLPPLDEAPMATDPAARAIATGAAPAAGAYMAPAAPATGAAGIGAPMPDEFLEYEEDFRVHYDDQYAQEGARYEDYSGAYHYGAKMGQDVRFRDRPWDDVEPEARREWETTPNGDTWERFKAAVRHGWERVTGHHHV